tara:strand:- start:660 stop:1580 length:921 start_codon:yes stop_codon:yes gene_type:complete
MFKKSLESIIQELEDLGMTTRKFTITNEGSYCDADADWNYKDIPHANFMHSDITSRVFFCEDNSVTSLVIQKFLSIFKLPLCLTNYEYQKNELIYFTSFLFFILVIRTKIIPVLDSRTKVETTYCIASQRLLNFIFFPLLKWMLLKNNSKLMRDDIPMRERRADLRRRGYKFVSKNGSDRFGYSETLLLTEKGLRIPKHMQGLQEYSVYLKDIDKNRDQCFGSSDHKGIRIIRTDSEILVFPRICNHQGGDLSEAELVAGKIKCPWHGLLCAPICKLTNNLKDSKSNGPHSILINNKRCIIKTNMG